MAAQETGVPFAVLLAVTLTETGRTDGGGALRSWPWALNRGGEGHWFDTREEALAFLDQALAEGSSNIDVGCFQLNYRWHGAAFASVEQMMDPEKNALYAANHLAGLFEGNGDWVAAAAAYHSATPEYAERYLARFEPIYRSLSPEARPEAEAWPDNRDFARSEPERVNDFPLLRSGSPGTGGSLVPLDGRVRPLFGGS